VFGKKDIAINGVTMVQGRGDARRQTQSNRANHKYGRIVARRIVAPRPLPLIDPPARLTAAKQSAGGFICWQETPIPRLSHPRCWRSSILSPPPPPGDRSKSGVSPRFAFARSIRFSRNARRRRGCCRAGLSAVPRRIERRS